MKSLYLLASFSVLAILGCADDNSNSVLQEDRTSASSSRALFVASGACYGGGVTTSTGVAAISSFDLDTGEFKKVILDYNVYSPGDSPVGVQDYDSETLLVTVENTAGRRLDLVKKDGSSVSTYLTNATAFNAVLRFAKLLPDYSLLVSKSSAIEKFGANKGRVLQGANPYVNAPAGACATSTTLISGIDVFANGKIIYTHAAATPNNRFAIIASTGYAVAGDCLAGQAGPTTTALPTSVLNHSSGKTLVAYGSTTAASNFIYSYDINSSTNVISNTTAAFNDNSVVNGPSAMAEDTVSGDVFVANSTATFNTILRFNFNSTTRTLTQVSGQPFVPASIYTRCVSGLAVGSDD